MLESAGEWLRVHWRDGIEILILSTVFYFAYGYLKETRGARIVLFVVAVIVGLALLAHLLALPVVAWLVRWLTVLLVVVLVVIFQPELRRALAELGSYRLFSVRKQKAEFVERLDEVVRMLSAKRFGALFAIERRIELHQYLETGVEIDGEFSPELIMSIFHPKTALHDGGMILRQDTIVGAGCVFPVSQREMMDRSIGLRHRAGMGITEETDAIAIVVSEETGTVSICQRGEIERDLDAETFRKRLAELLFPVGRKDEEAEEEEKEKEARERRTTTDGGTAKELEG